LNDKNPLEHEPMRMNVVSSDPATYKTNELVIGVFADGTFPTPSQAVDAASKGRLSELLKLGDMEPKVGSTLMLYDLPGVSAARVLVVNLGPRDAFNAQAYFKALGAAAKALSEGKARTAAITLMDVDVPRHTLPARLQNASRIIADGAYRFNVPRANHNNRQREDENNRGARDITFVTTTNITPDLEEAVRRGQAIAEGMALTKDLGNLPGNVCNPTYLAETARAMGKEFGFDVEILEREGMEKLGMFSALSVGRASDQPCKFIVMQYKGDGGSKPIVLVGKGVTFDTGGVSLKPGENMDMMKYDMSGAGSVFGVMKTVARMKLPINLVGIIGAVENMPGGSATRPGDVVRSMSGITIEILNTDAEGRLVLCDSLTYAERFNPSHVIDIATLTGACVIALGNQTTGLFANDDKLAADMLACGQDTGDRAWQLPLWDEYFDQLKSNFADMSNIGGRPAGTITAACFLSKFVNGYKWAHLDVAGTASVGGEAKASTGRPVPLLTEFLIRQAGQSKQAARAS
jgi:leucyl aminopeptidase